MQGHVEQHGEGQSAQPMLRESELARRWGVSRRTLQRWRAAGCGPTYHLMGRAIRYRLDQVIAFEALTAREGEQ